MIKKSAFFMFLLTTISLLGSSNHWDPRGKHLSHGSFSSSTPHSQFVRCSRCGASFYRNTSHFCQSCSRCHKVHHGPCK